MRDTAKRREGFTIVELLIVFVIITLLAAIGAPAIQSRIHQAQMEAVARETALLMQNARLEAVRQRVPTVVFLNVAAGRVEAFADVNDAGGNPGSDLLFNPVGGATPRSTDYSFGGTPLLRRGIFFWGEADASPLGGDEVAGFTVDPGGGLNMAVFETDGSIRAIGAFRFGDNQGNFLEVRVSPQATGRTEVRKFNDDLVNPEDGSFYHPKGNRATGDAIWEWD